MLTVNVTLLGWTGASSILGPTTFRLPNEFRSPCEACGIARQRHAASYRSQVVGKSNGYDGMLNSILGALDRMACGLARPRAPRQQPVRGALDAVPATAEHVGVDHLWICFAPEKQSSVPRSRPLDMAELRAATSAELQMVN